MTHARRRPTDPEGPAGTERVRQAAAAGLVPPATREHAAGDPPSDAAIAATKEAILARLDGDGAAASYWQLVDGLDADHYTLRLALEELHDAGRVRPAAVFWRPDRTDGAGPPVSGLVGAAGDGAEG